MQRNASTDGVSGELHILDSRIVPNARRDYFQPGPHLRNLENQLTPVLSNISTRCRQESTARNRTRKALAALCNIEDLYDLATSGYLTTHDSARLVQEALRRVEELRASSSKGTLDNGTLERLDNAEDNLINFSVETELQQFGDMPTLEVAALQRVFGALATLADSPASAREMIERVFVEVGKAGQIGSGLNKEPRHYSKARPAPDDAESLKPR